MPSIGIRTCAFLVSFATLAVGLSGCKSGESTDGPSRGAVMNARSPIATYRSRLDQIQPRFNATIDSASNLLAQADTDPRGAIRAFDSNVNMLRSDVTVMRQQVDELQRLGFQQYFLGSDRTTAISSDPAVTDARQRYGFLGDYMVSLRDRGVQAMGQLESISTAVNANPTAAGIRSQQDAIARLAPTRIEVNSLIDLLRKSVDEMPRN